MRQVPQNLNSARPSATLLIGSGRLARHLAYYFELLEIPFVTWARKSGDVVELQARIQDADRILIAISDSALEDFINKNSTRLKEKLCVHFSGALKVKAAWSFHPLMSFSEKLYSLDTYRAIPFVSEEGAPAFSEIFPELPNPVSTLANEKRALYHALCSMGGNFSVLLWEYVMKSFEQNLGLRAEILRPYLRQISANLEQEMLEVKPASVLTGPLVRGDTNTIEQHLAALRGDSMKPVYEAFVSAYQQQNTARESR